EFRITEQTNLKNFDRIFAFGDDQTIAYLKNISPISVSGFGSGISINLLKNPHAKHSPYIAKDMLSLAQRGCLSTRALFVYDTSWEQIQSFLENLNNECRKFHGSELNIKEQVALDHENLSLNRNSIFTMERKNLNDMLFPIYKMKDEK